DVEVALDVVRVVRVVRGLCRAHQLVADEHERHVHGIDLRPEDSTPHLGHPREHLARVAVHTTPAVDDLGQQLVTVLHLALLLWWVHTRSTDHARPSTWSATMSYTTRFRPSSLSIPY